MMQQNNNKKNIKLLTQWLASLLVVSLFFQLEYFSDLDERYNDYWRRDIAQKSQPTEEILIIEIDDKSLTEMESQVGRWPWPRTIHAFLVEGLIAAQAKVIVFDILFSEKDLYQPDADIYFAESVSGKNNVFFAATELSANSPVDSVAFDSLPVNFFSQSTNNKLANARIKINLPLIINPKDWNIGLINVYVDSDGIVRKYPLETERDGWIMQSLPQKVINAIKTQSTKPKTNQTVRNLRYKNGSLFNYLSYVDAKYLLDNQQQLDYFKDKIVLIGSNATGLHDFHQTPIAARYPGTSILATVIDNLINDDFLTITDRKSALLLLLLMVSIMWLIAQFIDGYKKQMLLSALLLVLFGGSLYLISLALSRSGILFPSASSFTILAACMVIMIFYRGLKEYLSRQHALQTFSRFMDPVIVKQLIADENWQQKIANRTSNISVLFSDIRGFTTLSEKRSAEEVMQLLNGYFDLQVEAIFNTRGTLDKFIGDAIMAFWGAPVEDPRHAVNAVETALLMVDNLMIFRQTLPKELRDFDVGIGVHSGDAVVGMLGSSKRFDYTAIGDTVNLASRIEGATKGVARVLVSEATKNLCGDVFNFEYRGEFSVKGREQKVKLYQPSRLASQVSNLS